MPEKPTGSEEDERKKIWRDLVVAAEAIDEATHDIRKSGPDFLGRQAIIEQLRKKYGWYEKWRGMSDEDIHQWVMSYNMFRFNFSQKSKMPVLSYGECYRLAHACQAEAVHRHEIQNPAPGLGKALEGVQNTTLEDTARHLEQIVKFEHLNFAEIRAAAQNILRFVQDIKTGVIYRSFSEQERTLIGDFVEEIQANIDKEEVLRVEVIDFREYLARVIRRQKKKF